MMEKSMDHAITAKSKCDLVVDEVMSRIARGEYSVGDKLPTESELTKMFSVSRVTIREAVKRLNALGIISVKQGAGTFIQKTDVTSVVRPLVSTMVLNELSIAEIYDARLFVEVGNVRLAARNRTSQDVTLLKSILDETKKTLAPYDADAFSRFDNRFHEAIGQMSGNTILSSTYSALKELLRYYINQTNISQKTAEVSLEHHDQIFACIANGEEHLAGDIMERHIIHAKTALLSGASAASTSET